ncbi:SulP family inorganic anion transporter, partial [Micromonospora zhanjiangensis]
SAAVGVATLALLVCWEWTLPRLRTVPGPLVAVALAAVAAWTFRLPVATVEVGALFDALIIPDRAALVRLADVALLGTTLTIAVIATAESLFSAAAVDRMHDGPGTRYNAELVAQGAGNLSAGALGAPPMTAVIVRSSANVRAGGRTRLSPVLHGVWLLVFAASLPDLLGVIPIPALAALLVHAGWKLLDPAGLVRALRADRAEGASALVTAVLNTPLDLLTGVLAGFALAVVRTAWWLSHVEVHWTRTDDDDILVRITGNATFLRLPQVLAKLDRVPPGARLRMDLSGLRHLDEAARGALDAWAADRRRTHGAVLTLAPPAPDPAPA